MKKIIIILFLFFFLLNISDDKSVMKNENNKIIALTFDDGPKEKTTSRLLDELKKRNVHVTFFALGRQIEQYPNILKRINDEGHLIGNHTYNHYNLSKLNDNMVKKELNNTSNLIFSITGNYPKYYRPSYGSISKRQIKKINLKLVKWTIDSKDWKYQNTKKIVNKVLNSVNNKNEIILMHDIYDTSIDAAIIIIDNLRTLGYKFVTIDEYFNYLA